MSVRTLGKDNIMVHDYTEYSKREKAILCLNNLYGKSVSTGSSYKTIEMRVAQINFYCITKSGFTYIDTDKIFTRKSIECSNTQKG